MIGIGLGLGWLYRRSGRFSTAAPVALNAYVIAIALPALVLAQLPPFLREWGARLDGSGLLSLLFLPLIPWLLFAVAVGVFGLMYRAGWIRRDQWVMLALAGGLGNTSFVGLPLVEALLGAEEIPRVILLDQLGTFLALSVAGTFWISWSRARATDSGRFSKRKFLRDIVRFPPFIALIAAFVLIPLGPLPQAVAFALERIGATLVPVAMVAVGAQLNPNFATFRTEGRALTFGLGFKLGVAPLGVFLLGGALGIGGSDFQVGVLEAAMAPMITATVLGIEAGFAPSLGALMLGVGIPLSLLTVPLWSRVFH